MKTLLTLAVAIIVGSFALDAIKCPAAAPTTVKWTGK